MKLYIFINFEEKKYETIFSRGNLMNNILLSCVCAFFVSFLVYIHIDIIFHFFHFICVNMNPFIIYYNYCVAKKNSKPVCSATTQTKMKNIFFLSFCFVFLSTYVECVCLAEIKQKS